MFFLQFFPNLLSSSISNAVESSEEIDDSDIDERATSYQYHQTGSANKFLGVTATTSQVMIKGLYNEAKLNSTSSKIQEVLKNCFMFLKQSSDNVKF